ncbi:hypothetical protein C8R45DRAFT_1029660, partial [Mycena sanguinolenta]
MLSRSACYPLIFTPTLSGSLSMVFLSVICVCFSGLLLVSTHHLSVIHYYFPTIYHPYSSSLAVLSLNPSYFGFICR